MQHLWGFIKLEQTERIVPIFDQNKRVRSTNDMPTWFTSKPCFITQHSQISHCVFDSAWEATESYVLEKNPHVTAWVKNDHLGFEILYVFDGVVRKYTPDFLIKLDNGKTLILETKGQETRRETEKRKHSDPEKKRTENPPRQKKAQDTQGMGHRRKPMRRIW